MKCIRRLLIVLSLLIFFALVITPVIAQDDATVRIAYFAFDPSVYDTYIDGEIASFSAGWSKVGWKVPLVFLPTYRPDSATPYFSMETGTHSFSFVPSGASMDAPLLGPEEIALEAGHRYSLAVIGDMEAGNLSVLTIDETEACVDIDHENNHVSFFIHNVYNGPPITLVSGDRIITDSLEYGEWVLNIEPVEFAGSVAYFTDDPTNKLFELVPSGVEHRTIDMTSITGKYPGEVGQDIFWDYNWAYYGDATIDDGGMVSVGDVVGGEISSSTHRMSYTLTLNSPMTIDVFVLGTGARTADSMGDGVMDPMLYIYDDEENLLFWNDEGTGLSMHKGGEEGAFDAALETVGLDAGVYKIHVGGFADLIGGPFGLIVRQTPGT